MLRRSRARFHRSRPRARSREPSFGVLIGLGLTEFSMTPAAIPAARHLVGSVHAGRLRTIVSRALQLGTHREIENYLEETAGLVQPGMPLVGRAPGDDRSRP